MKPTFSICPPGVVQWRKVPVSDSPYQPRRTFPPSVWRTEHCNDDRWHYWENPCNCYAMGRPYVHEILDVGYELQEVHPETGTWRRDGQYIESELRRGREQANRERLAFAAARGAAGPQKPLFNPERIWFAIDFAEAESRIMVYLTEIGAL